MGLSFAEKSEVQAVEDYIVRYTQKNGYLPKKKEILTSLHIGTYRLATCICLSEHIHLVIPENKKLSTIKLSGPLLESVINHFKSNPMQGKYFEQFISALEENISYERHT